MLPQARPVPYGRAVSAPGLQWPFQATAPSSQGASLSEVSLWTPFALVGEGAKTHSPSPLASWY